MNITIIGANGRVGTELCFLFRKAGHTVHPVVRNKLGAAFLHAHGFKCTIGDMAQEMNAEQALKESTVVVIAAYTLGPDGVTTGTHAINQKIIVNATHYSEKNAMIVYFSSIRAFSEEVDENTPGNRLAMTYDSEKRELENILWRACTRESKKGYALRLGHVVGKNQPKASKFHNAISVPETWVDTYPDAPSNIVHTITIMDAVLACAADVVEPGTYSLVNSPQWTWKEVFEYYADPLARIHFTGKKRTKSNPFFSMAMLRTGKNIVMPFRTLMPKKISEKMEQYYLRKKIRSEIAELEQSIHVNLSEFAYKPIPGPFISGLPETRERLKKADVSKGIFE